jgi:hypothetical protein
MLLKITRLVFVVAVGLSLVAVSVFAQDLDPQLKEKYGLTDQQLTGMKGQGLKGPEIAKAAELSKASGKSLDEVLKMRTEQKMGWGKIAKELGVDPGKIGHAVSDLNHERRDDRKERREERREDRKERREERKARRESRREAREERRESRQERREERQEKRADH